MLSKVMHVKCPHSQKPQHIQTIKNTVKNTWWQLMIWITSTLQGSRDSLLVRAPDSWSKGCEFESRQKRRENVLFRVNFVCWLLLLLFGVRSTPVLPQWHPKDPGHSAKSAGGRFYLNTYRSLTQRSRSGLTMLHRRSLGTSQGNEFTRY